MSERIEIEKLRRLIDDGAQLVEVLPAQRYRERHLPGAINIPLKELSADTAATLERANPVVVYCWDYLWDLSPRAACRLETLGFEHVHDYAPGKADWLARALPIDGELSQRPTAGGLMHDDFVTVPLAERIDAARRRIDESPYGYALVVSANGVLLGRLRRSACDVDADATAEAVMEPGPSTVRPDTWADELAERLRSKELKTAIVSDPEGRPLGVVRLRDLAAASE